MHSYKPNQNRGWYHCSGDVEDGDRADGRVDPAGRRRLVNVMNIHLKGKAKSSFIQLGRLA